MRFIDVFVPEVLDNVQARTTFGAEITPTATYRRWLASSTDLPTWGHQAIRGR